MSKLQHIEDAVKYYVENTTSFALLITGKWGSGKTFYYDNFIAPKTSTITIPNSPLKYLPVRISLYGLNSIEELESSLVAEIYPITKSSTLKTGLKLSKSLIRGFIKTKTEVDIDDFIPNSLNPENSDILDKSRLLICLDDLERKGNNLDYKQIIGYVNSLVEDTNTKVIILANENTMENEEYKIFKEKTIGITIVFEQELEYIFPELIKKYKSTNSNYHQFLEDNFSTINNLTTSTNNNLRMIISSIDRFESVFNLYINSKFCSDKQIAVSTMKFCFGVNIEFLKGKIDNTKKAEIETQNNSFNRLDWDRTLKYMQEQSGKKPEASYKDNFIEQYFQSMKYNYYESIFDYITKYIPLDENKLTKEIEELFPNDEELDDHILTFRKLSNSNVGKLNEADYLSLTNKLIDFASQGQYILTDTLSIPFFVMRFDNPLNYSMEKLTKLILKGINKRKNHNLYEPMLEMQINSIPPDHPHYTYMQDIGRAAMNINKITEIKKQKELSIELNLKAENDTDEFIRIISSQNESLHKPVFINTDPKSFFNIIKTKFNNEQIELLSYTITRRHIPHLDINKEDLPFLHKLGLLLDKHLSKAPKTVNRYYLKILNEAIKKTVPLYDISTGNPIQYS